MIVAGPVLARGRQHRFHPRHGGAHRRVRIDAPATPLPENVASGPREVAERACPGAIWRHVIGAVDLARMPKGVRIARAGWPATTRRRGCRADPGRRTAPAGRRHRSRAAGRPGSGRMPPRSVGHRAHRKRRSRGTRGAVCGNRRRSPRSRAPTPLGVGCRVDAGVRGATRRDSTGAHGAKRRRACTALPGTGRSPSRPRLPRRASMVVCGPPAGGRRHGNRPTYRLRAMRRIPTRQGRMRSASRSQEAPDGARMHQAAACGTQSVACPGGFPRVAQRMFFPCRMNTRFRAAVGHAAGLAPRSSLRAFGRRRAAAAVHLLSSATANFPPERHDRDQSDPRAHRRSEGSRCVAQGVSLTSTAR